MDLLPTIAAITGAALPAWPIDGKNILPLLEGAPGVASPTDAFYYYDGTFLEAVRVGRWKLHIPHGYRATVQPGMDGAVGVEQWTDLPLSLFDLDADPGETTNVADQNPDVVSRLMSDLTAFDADMKMNLRPAGQL
jgi:arylsulfatase A